MTKIAIIGAGLAGLTAAKTLNNAAQVTVFEKSGRPSGRMATRRADPYAFDHGAQFFGARTPEFKNFLAPMIEQGVVVPWGARFVEIEEGKVVQTRDWNESYPHYVGVPGMNAVGKHLSKGLNLRLSTLVQVVEKIDEQWSLRDADGTQLGMFDWVLTAIPAQQTVDLLPASIPFQSDAAAVEMQGCYSVMLGFEDPLPLEYDAALISGADISWISVNSAKPGRRTPFSLLVHSTNSWADDHCDDDREGVLAYLCEQISQTVGLDLSTAQHKAIHQWRYANVKKRGGEACFFDPQHHVGSCGDWLVQGRVEAAFTSGFSLAKRVLNVL